MKKLLLFFAFLVIGTVMLEAQTTKCGISLEACKKTCVANPDCSPSPNCTPADCKKVATSTAKTTAEAMLTSTTSPKACQRKAKTTCRAQAAKQEKAVLASTEVNTNLVVKQD